MDRLVELLRQGADKIVNFPTEAQRFLTNPQAFTELVTGKNPLPKETGFVAGATGLPAKNPVQGGVLNPASAPYQEGYEQGEPVAIAAMAVPAYATALRAGAPKAYNALENYMVKSGGMIPLEAYHGTPHKIEGAFDINKVGTGEGAQAYGHGMYFAENPAVAKEYQKMLAGPEQTAAEYLKMYKTPESAISALEYGITPNLTAEAKKFSQDAIDVIKSGKELKGNLYKVDIPDADIPMMLDYDKPLSQQPKAVQKALAKIDPDLYSKKGMDYDPQETGQMIYQRLSQIDMNKNGPFTGASRNVSNMLNKYGIKGIRYLDEGSRAEGKGTSNFVVFEPSNVKILEQNNKPVTRKELIQEQINKI